MCSSPVKFLIGNYSEQGVETSWQASESDVNSSAVVSGTALTHCERIPQYCSLSLHCSSTDHSSAVARNEPSVFSPPELFLDDNFSSPG